MNVLVDTSVWSLALRRQSPRGSDVERELTELIGEGRVLMLGAIRQELLSGLRTNEQFEKLRDGLRSFPDETLAAGDYEEAASCFNRCRSKGVQGSNMDFLLCAVALRLRVPILTTDDDFKGFAKYLKVELYTPR